MLSHHSAAEIDRLIDKPAASIHVTIPGNRRIVAIGGVVVHVSLSAERVRHPVRLPPRTRVEETVLDLTDCCDDPTDAVDWIARAMGRRLTTQQLLSDAVSRRTRLRWRAEIADMLNPDLAGVHSALEYRYVRFVERPHALPVSKRQVRVQRNGTREYRDVLYEEYALIVELDDAAVVLLLAGGIFWLIGWLVGLTLLWASPRWSTRDKLLGSVIWPGGTAGLLAAAASYYIVAHPDGAANVISGLLRGGAATVAVMLAVALLVALPQVVVAVRLIRRARLPEQADLAEG